ncbi:MAG: dihydrofolate reductase family protein [Jatrophihabitans sp.]
MRALLPAPVDDVDLHAYYAAGWLDRGGIRANFVSSVDGAVSTSGTSKTLQTESDGVVFAVLRDLADVVLVGAGTAVAECYHPIPFSERRLEIRRSYGLRPELPVAVISRSLRLDPDDVFFTDATAAQRPIVLTTEAADAEKRRLLKQVADVVDCGDQVIDSVLVRQALVERGLTRILCEGGPTVLNDLIREGVVDELCVTLAPTLVGGGPPRMTGDHEWAAPAGVTLVGLVEDAGNLFCRYTLTVAGR